MTEMLKTSETTEKLLKFIDASPSCFHAVKNICVMLEDAGCIRLLENETWTLEKGKRYFTTRNGSSVLAFSVPENYNGMQIVSAHSDSPTFRVKSGAEITVEGHYKKLNTEGYGGMILSTWFDRPLSLAGRAVVRTESGVKSVLLNIDRDLCIIPSLAIHMTRGMADHKLNPQVDLLPLLGGENADYNALIAEEAGVKKEDVISSDMFLYPRQHGVVFGMENEFIASPRLDDLQCAFSATEAFSNAENKEKLLISAVFDNEEVGSLTKQGADSTFLTDTVRRIAAALNIPEAEWLRKMPDSFMLSADNAHAVHPNYTEKCDQTNRCYLNGGIVIKYSANQKYTTDSVSAAVFCMKHQRQIQQPCFQLRIFAIWPHHSQQVFRNGFIWLWLPQYHAAALVEVLRHLVVIHCQRWETGNQFQTLPHNIRNADVIRFRVGGMQCQHTLFHAVHDVIARHPHDNAAFKMCRQVLIICQQFVKGFQLVCFRQFSSQ